MKHARFFDDFLDREVNLNQSRLDRLSAHVEAITKYLANNLFGFRGMERQGSYGLATIIKPARPDKEYDADMLLNLTHEAGKKPREYINAVYECFRSHARYRKKVHRRTRCVVLQYARKFHLDIVPCLASTDGTLWICNRRTDRFEPTDGTGYRDWFNSRNALTGGHLKRVIRLLKYLRDHKQTFAVKSILLTTFAGRTVVDGAVKSDFHTVPDTLLTVVHGMNHFLQRHPDRSVIRNPVLPTENFTRHWDQTSYSNFRRLFDSYARKMESAFQCADHNESVDKWREVFGSRFGTKRAEHAAAGVHAGSAVGVGNVSVSPPKPYAR